MTQLKTTAVRIVVRGPDGQVPAGAVVVADLIDAKQFPSLGIGLDEGVVVPSRVQAMPDANGVAVLPLWPNTRGQGGTQYRIQFLSAAKGKLADILAVVPEVAGGVSIDLEAIAGLPVPPPIYGLLPLAARVAALEQLVADLIAGGGLPTPSIPANTIFSNGKAIVSGGKYVTLQ